MDVIARAPVPPARIHVHEGFFADTLARVATGPVAVLRLDGDWYSRRCSVSMRCGTGSCPAGSC